MLVKAIVLTWVLLLVPCFLAFAQESEQDQDVKNPDGEAIPREYKGYKLGTDYREYPDLYFDRHVYGGDVPLNRLHISLNDSKDNNIDVYAYIENGLIYKISWKVAHDADSDSFRNLIQAAKDNYKYVNNSRYTYPNGVYLVSIDDNISTINYYYFMGDTVILIALIDVSIYNEYMLWVWYYNNNPKEFAKWKAEALLPK